MLVHAHPDDESIGTGATMARYVSEGAQVTLVTCTLGEEGEIVVPDLEHLAADREDGLGVHRIGELSEAMAALGVTDFLRLGGDGRYRDSGMAYDEQRNAIARFDNTDNSFWRSDLLEATNQLVPLIRDRRPQVMITYDENGGYGHPDHVMAHRVATYAVVLAGVTSYRPDLGAPWEVERVLWTAIAANQMRSMIKMMRDQGNEDAWGGFDLDGDALPPMSSPDESIVVVIDGQDHFQVKIEALRAHRSQIAADSFFLNSPGEVGIGLATESFRLAGGTPFPVGAVADDVFAGLASVAPAPAA